MAGRTCQEELGVWGGGGGVGPAGLTERAGLGAAGGQLQVGRGNAAEAAGAAGPGRRPRCIAIVTIIDAHGGGADGTLWALRWAPQRLDDVVLRWVAPPARAPR